jgi:arylformamidase
MDCHAQKAGCQIGVLEAALRHCLNAKEIPVQEHDVEPSTFWSMDQAERDSAYNNSKAVADSAERLEDWARRSSACRGAADARTDIRYGDLPNNCFDYFPSGAQGAPLFVFIHGGYWQRNSKDIFAFVSNGPRARGINVATIGYTLAPKASLSDIVAEVFQALDRIRSHAEALKFDPDRVYVGGWSAGGHLATLCAARPTVRGVLSISGILDLAPIALTYLNENLQLTREEILRLSPINTLADLKAPVSLFVGGEELPELQRQSRDYARLAQAGGQAATFAVIPGCNHYTIMEQLASSEGVLTTALADMIVMP